MINLSALLERACLHTLAFMLTSESHVKTIIVIKCLLCVAFIFKISKLSLLTKDSMDFTHFLRWFRNLFIKRLIRRTQAFYYYHCEGIFLMPVIKACSFLPHFEVTFFLPLSFITYCNFKSLS